MRLILFLATLLIALSLTVCSKKKISSRELPYPAEKIGKSWSDTKTELNEQYQSYQATAKEKLDEIERWFDNVSSQAKQAKEDTRQEIEELKRKKEKVQKQYQEFKGSSEKAWVDLKKGLDDAMEDLEDSFQRARSRFK